MSNGTIIREQLLKWGLKCRLIKTLGSVSTPLTRTPDKDSLFESFSQRSRHDGMASVAL